MIHRVCVLLSALSLCAAAQVHATVFAPAEWSEFVLAARAIVHGRIIDVRPRETGDGRRVETIVTMQVATYLKGDLGSRITFRVPGGRVGRYRTIVLGAPSFRAGEEVVLLLGARGPSIPYVVGMNQGVFRVVDDSATGDRHVAPVPMRGNGAEWTPVVRGD